MKIKILALLIFLLNINCTISAYTREDLEKYRTISAVVSAGSMMASAINSNRNGNRPDSLLRMATSISLIINSVLNIALEKNPYILVPIASIVSGFIESNDYNHWIETGMLPSIIQGALHWWVCDVIHRKYPLKEQEITRRALRAFTLALVVTIFKGRSELEMQNNIFFIVSRLVCFLIVCISANILECMGYVVAHNVTENQPVTNEKTQASH